MRHDEVDLDPFGPVSGQYIYECFNNYEFKFVIVMIMIIYSTIDLVRVACCLTHSLSS